MKKQLLLLLLLLTAAGATYAQNTDTLATSQTDSIYLSPSAKALEEVQVIAQRPLFAVDGEKQLYNVAEDPSVQNGSATDALQNTPGIEVDAEGNITLRGSQSVEVWLNDRPSHLSGENLKEYLKLLPANSIERIEVISNPSARYGGGGPVVNIVTTKRIQRNEFLALGASGNQRPQVSPWLSYVYGGKKFSFNAYVEYDYSHTWSNGQGSITLLTPSGDLTATQSSTSRHDYYRHGGYLHFSGTYDFDTQRTLTFWAGGYPSFYRSATVVEQDWREYIYAPGNYSFHATNDGTVPQGGYFAGADYTRRFDDKGRKLWLRGGINGYGYQSTATMVRQYAEQPTLDRQLWEVMRFDNWAMTNLDGGYAFPFANDWEAEVGGSFNYNFPSHYHYTRDSLPGLRRDTLRSFSRSNTELSYHAFATLQRRLGHFTAKAGLQLGQDHSSTSYSGYRSVETQARFPFWVPSLHLSYHTDNMHNFALSYTHRSSRPGAVSLSDFIEYGEWSFTTGNPQLVPAHTHNVEGSWQKYWDGFGSLGLNFYYRASTNQIGTLNDVVYHPVYGRAVSFSVPANIGRSHTAGAMLNLTYRPTAFFNARLELSLDNYAYHVLFRPDQWNDRSQWNASVRLNVWTKLWNKLQLFGNIRYNTRQLTFMYFSDPTFVADLGVSADLLDRRLSLYLNAKDLFGSYVSTLTGLNPYLASASTQRNSSRYVSLGLTLRLGKMELEDKARTGGQK